jgi:hypothetical protein
MVMGNIGLTLFLIRRTIEYIEGLLQTDIETNKSIGRFGANAIAGHLAGKVNVLTHCNTGSLATCGFGTALGVVRSLFEKNQLGNVFFIIKWNRQFHNYDPSDVCVCDVLKYTRLL